jgi:uncharacterized protein YkwD
LCFTLSDAIRLALRLSTPKRRRAVYCGFRLDEKESSQDIYLFISVTTLTHQSLFFSFFFLFFFFFLIDISLANLESGSTAMKFVFATLAFVFLIGISSAAIPAGWPFGFNDGAALCAKWTAEYKMTDASPWVTGASPNGKPGTAPSNCVAGTTTTQAKEDVFRVINLFRYYAGVDPVDNYDSTKDTQTQECSLMGYVNGSLYHTEYGPSNGCYTANGLAGCAGSNLAFGIQAPHSNIAFWIQDNGVTTVGHRRWIYAPKLDKISFGLYGSGTGGQYWASLFVTQSNNSRVLQRGYWSFPPEGVSPLQQLLAVSFAGKVEPPETWNYASANLTSSASISSCEITRNDGVSVRDSSKGCYVATSSSGTYKSLVFPVSKTASAKAGCYTVNVNYKESSDGASKNLNYKVTLWDCGATDGGATCAQSTYL